jgi:hypothetical protein
MAVARPREEYQLHEISRRGSCGFKAGDPIANSHAWETVCSLGFFVATRKVKRKVRLLKETSARRD